MKSKEFEKRVNLMKSRKKAYPIFSEILYYSLLRERDLDQVILTNFIKEEGIIDFYNDVLMDEKFPVSLKIKIAIRSKVLRKAGYKGVEKDLMRLFEIRNIIAHGFQLYDEESKGLVLITRKSKKKLDDLFWEWYEIDNKMTIVFERIKGNPMYANKSFEECLKEMKEFEKKFNDEFAKWEDKKK